MTDTSTTTPTSISPGTATTARLAPSVAKILAALHHLGEATAAETAAAAGLGYSTTTPKLRTLEDQGLAEPVRGDDGHTIWRLTDNGRAYAEQDQTGDAGATGTQSSIAEPANTDASNATTAAIEDRQRADCASEPFDDPPAQAEMPDEETPDSGHRTDPSNPAETATTDDPAATAAAGSVPDTPEAGGAATDTDATRAAASTSAASPADPVAETAARTGGRRAPGTLRGAILDILEANPDKQYKVSELCRLIDKAHEGTGAKKAGAGAVVNAANKLAQDGRAVLAVEKPATFALTDADNSTS